MPDIFVAKNKKEKEKKRPHTSTDNVPKKMFRHNIPGHTHNPLSAFCYLPDKIDFETKDKEEIVILLLRKHFITNVGWILILLLMILAPLVLRFFPIISFLPPNYQLVAILGWYLLTTAYFLESFLTWFFNVYIVTDERIIDIDFYNLIYKEVSDANIERIQDVTYKMGGVIRTIFNYGDVYIQTAAEVPSFEFEAVPRPDRVASILQELRIEEEQEKLEGRVR